jgi:hypothetical protein
MDARVHGVEIANVMKVTITPIQPFPVEGKGSDPLLPSMGRTQEG